MNRAPRAGGQPPIARMVVAVLSLLGLLVATYLTLYKLGYVGKLQCAIGGCEIVQASKYAYFLGLPVALWGVVAYACLLVLSLAGLQPGRADDRRIGTAIFVISGLGVLFSAYLTFLEASVIHAWCQWCVSSAVMITLVFLFSIPGLFRGRVNGKLRGSPPPGG